MRRVYLAGPPFAEEYRRRASALLVLISIILAALGLRRSRDGGAGGVRFARIVGVICMLLLAAYVVAVWAMTAKPD